MTATAEAPPTITVEDEQLQAALADATRSGEVVKYESPAGKGMLSIDPEQTDWTPAQRVALQSINIPTEGPDAVPIPNVLQFLHLCQMRDLDPFLGEAHLVTYGKINRKEGRTYDDRSFKLIVGIDGFRKRGEDSGEYAGTTVPEWCGEDEVWREVWDKKRHGNPVAARIGIFRKGHDVPTYGVAMFEEFVPMVEIWEGRGQNARRTGKFQPTPMWIKMPANQIVKCAEAQAWRRAFPRRMSGMYAPEEMERAVAEYAAEKRQAEQEASQERRMAAYAARQQPKAPADDVITGVIVDDSQNRSQQPLSAAQAAEGAVAEMRARQTAREAADAAAAGVTDAQRLVWLVEEIRMQSEMLGQSIEELTKRQSDRLDGKPYREFDANELQFAVNPWRKPTAMKLRAAGREDEAHAYAAAKPGVAYPMWMLLGQTEPKPEPEPVDPTKPHKYANQQGICVHCEREEDDRIHGVTT